MNRKLILSGLVSLSVLSLGACVDQPEDTSDIEQFTSGAGASGVTNANVLLGDGEFEIKWDGKVAKLEGEARLIHQTLTIQPGGHTGWHTHPGPVLISVSSGALTVKYASSPCAGPTYAAGTGWVDAGGAFVHIAQNLGSVPAVVHAQYIVPNGSGPRVDAPAPDLSGCQ